MTTRRLFFWIKVVVGLSLLSAIFVIIKPQDIWAAAKQADYFFILLGAALMPVNIALQEFKWRYLVRLVKPEVSRIETVGSLLGGIAFGIITPGRLGEYGRALFISGTTPLKLVGLTVIDKFYNLGFTIAVGLPAIATLPYVTRLTGGQILFGVMALLALVNGALLYLALDPRPVRSLIHSLQLSLPRGGRIAQLLGGLDRFSAPQARVTLAFTALHYVVFLMQYWLLISAFNSLDLLSSSRAAAAVLLTKSALPIAVADLGVDQLAAMQIFGAFNITNVAAVNASLLLFALNVLLPALAGIPFISRLQLSRPAAP